MTTNDEILALDARRRKAMVAGDTAELETLLHRDLTYTHSSGAIDTKNSYIGGVREKLWDYQSVESNDAAVTIHGDTALIHCRLGIDVIVKGVPRRVDSVALTVWIRDEGRWQVLAVHSTPYPKG
jgi:hypothetical protein